MTTPRSLRARLLGPGRSLRGGRLLLVALFPLFAPLLHAQGGPDAAYFAEAAGDGSVRVLLRSHASESPAPGMPEGVEWRRFHLRATSPELPEGAGGVLELEDPVPRLQVRADYQLFAYKGLLTDASGLGWVGSEGVELLLSSPDNRYVIFNEGAALSTEGTHVAFLMRGSLREEIHVADVRGPTPILEELLLPAEAERILPESLSVTRDAVFFGARSGGDRLVYRAPLSSSGGGARAPAERVAGPFKVLEPYFAASEGGVVFLAGDGSGELDVFVVPSLGVVVNVTRAPGPYLPHSPEDPRLAISRDARTVAYDLRIGGEPETFIHDVMQEGAPGATDITADERFNPYIDHESLIFFDATGTLVFAGGHDIVTTDVFRVLRSQPVDPINLTRTGSTLNPPFLTKGTLTVDLLRLAPGGLALISATGFPGVAGTEPLLAASDIATGDLLFTDMGLRSAAGFVSTGTALLFSATTPDGARAFYSMVGGQMTQVGVAAAGTEPRVLLLAGADPSAPAIVALPGTGVLSLGAGQSSTLTPVAGAITTADLDSTGRYLVYGTVDPGGANGAQFHVVDLTTGVETTIAAAPASSALLAVAQTSVAKPFLRGDANSDGSLDLADAVATLLYLFIGQDAVRCAEAADADDDGRLTVTDPVRVLNFLFRGGPALPPPAEAPGFDPTPDGLGCVGL